MRTPDGLSPEDSAEFAPGVGLPDRPTPASVVDYLPKNRMNLSRFRV